MRRETQSSQPNSSPTSVERARRIAKLFKLSIQRKSHPIRVLIEASAGPEDARQKSRWTQALRYAFGWRQPGNKLKWTLETNGGISGCAAKYAAKNEIALRKSDVGRNNPIFRQSALGEIPELNTAASDGLNPQE